uniref:Uncharacterized protein n=1 Tax=Anopheles quadriannulatus TaxID=34691 RepID=A0A182XT83_ANOQN
MNNLTTSSSTLPYELSPSPRIHSLWHTSTAYYFLRRYWFKRLFDGQYSAYSSQVQPVRVQHSAVIDPPDRRFPVRRVRRNAYATSRSIAHGYGTSWPSSTMLVRFSTIPALPLPSPLRLEIR